MRAPLVSVPAESAPDGLANGIADAFTAYLAAIDGATDLPSLDSAATGPGKPSKGTKEHKQATAAYLARKAALQQAVAS